MILARFAATAVAIRLVSFVFCLSVTPTAGIISTLKRRLANTSANVCSTT